MKIAIIDYNAGNTKSVQFALQRLGYQSFCTDDAQKIIHADKVIFPGVGHAAFGQKILKEKGLDQAIISLKQPVLGICLGMQLLCKHSQEGNVQALGIFETEVIPFEKTVRSPHVGWNLISNNQNGIFAGLDAQVYAYFVHSFFAKICTNTIATTVYEQTISASLSKDNFFACQFHPEKSADVGMQILKNFIQI